MATAADIARQARSRDIRGRWFLASPALVIIALASIGPLAIVMVYSFLAPGSYGDVIWKY